MYSSYQGQAVRAESEESSRYYHQWDIFCRTGVSSCMIHLCSRASHALACSQDSKRRLAHSLASARVRDNIIIHHSLLYAAFYSHYCCDQRPLVCVYSQFQRLPLPCTQGETTSSSVHTDLSVTWPSKLHQPGPTVCPLNCTDLTSEVYQTSALHQYKTAVGTGVDVSLPEETAGGPLLSSQHLHRSNNPLPTQHYCLQCGTLTLAVIALLLRPFQHPAS